MTSEVSTAWAVSIFSSEVAKVSEQFGYKSGKDRWNKGLYARYICQARIMQWNTKQQYVHIVRYSYNILIWCDVHNDVVQ